MTLVKNTNSSETDPHADLKYLWTLAYTPDRSFQHKQHFQDN